MSEIKSYSGIDNETYKEFSKIFCENKNTTKDQLIKKVEQAAKSDGNLSTSEKKLISDLDKTLTDKNNTVNIQSANIDAKSHKINFLLEIKPEKSILGKSFETIGKGFSALDIPLIKENKAIAKEEVMNKVDTYSHDVAGEYIDSKTGKSNESDKILLKHEALEISIREANPSMSYQQAHKIANKTYNWKDLLER